MRLFLRANHLQHPKRLQMSGINDTMFSNRRKAHVLMAILLNEFIESPIDF